MTVLLTIIHVLVALLLIVAVLMQAGKGGGLASSIGGGLSSSSVLGGRSAATFLSKTTTVLATTFLISCILQAALQHSTDELPETASERMLSEEGPYEVTPFAAPAADEATPSVLGGSGAQAGDGGESGAE